MLLYNFHDGPKSHCSKGDRDSFMQFIYIIGPLVRSGPATAGTTTSHVVLSGSFERQQCILRL